MAQHSFGCELTVAALLLPAWSVSAVDIPLNPRATYLHVASADSALDSPPISLAALGLMPGDIARLERLGMFDNGPQGETFVSLLGVFSSTNVLLPPANAHRVPGAIEAGVDFTSACTFFGCEPTNIPEDFAIGSPDASFTGICMVIPPGAAYLFVGPHDSLFEDNTDPNGDYALRITLLTCIADIAPAGSPDGSVDVDDLLAVILGWGPCANPGNCPADVAPPCGDDVVNVDDLIAIIIAWGPCA